MFHTGDIVILTYAYAAHPTKPIRYTPISEPALFLQHVSNGLAEVLCPDGKTVVCRPTQLRLSAPTHDREYYALRDLLFPEQDQAA